MSLHNYDIVLHHITSHYVIHLIYAIPKIYNNQPLLQYHMYPLSIPCNNVYPSFIPCNNVSSVLFFNSSSNVVSSFSSHNSLIILSISSKTGSISSSVLLHNLITSFPDSLLPKSSVSTLIFISFPVPVFLKIPSLFT